MDPAARQEIVVELVPEMIYRVRTTEPLSPTDGSPFGPRQYWQVSEASLDGDRIHARLASTGIDWMSMGPDGLYRPDVRAAFVTDDDAVVLMHYTGLVEPSPAFQAAAAEDRETGWDDQRIRLVVTFDTGDERYRWLTSWLFVAEGRLLGFGRLEYQVYRVACVAAPCAAAVDCAVTS